MNTYSDVTPYIDNRNQDIWQYLSKKYIINFRIYDTPNVVSGINRDNSEYIISLHESNLCKDVFTHELLHLYIIDKYFDIPDKVESDVSINENICKIFKEEHINALHNTLTHKLIYPYYKGMGYDTSIFTPVPKREFLHDVECIYKQVKLEEVIYPYQTIAYYVCFSIDAMCSEWFGDLFNNLLNIFKLKSPAFYEIMEQFVCDWNEKQDAKTLKGILDDFFLDLDDWIGSIINK